MEPTDVPTLCYSIPAPIYSLPYIYLIISWPNYTANDLS